MPAIDPLAPPPRPAPLRENRRRRDACVGAARALDLLASTVRRRTRLRSRVERAHLGLDLGRELVDRDEQRELTRAQRVEDLAVVAAGPHGAAVGDEAQAGEVVARFDE